MRIVIDLQGAQTASRYRGIGRYALSLSMAIIRNKGSHEVVIALNGNLSLEIDSILELFKLLLPEKNMRCWYAPDPGQIDSNGYLYRLRAAEFIRETFLASLKPDVILIPSLFEGFDNPAITSIGRTKFSIPVAVSFHDLIPFLNPEQYLNHRPKYKEYYLRQLEYLKQADLWLPVSISAAKELCSVGIEDIKKIVCVANAADHVFSPQVDAAEITLIFKSLGIQGKFIFYSGGFDPRKNVKSLVEAYLLLPSYLQSQHQLVLAGSLSDEEMDAIRNMLRSCPTAQKQLLFTGYICDATLAVLYSTCAVFVQPSTHEGFGLPALEAMACGAPVIGSNITSIPEVIGRDDALFCPRSAKSICDKLTQVLTDDQFRSELVAYGLVRAKAFDWNSSAMQVIAALSDLCLNYKPALPREEGRPKMALVSPLPPERTGIAYYSASLLPELSKKYDLQLVVADGDDVNAKASYPCPVRDASWLKKHGHEMDYVVYQFGNSAFHGHMFSLLESVPGIVVLHDFYLSDLLFFYEMNGAAPHIWTEALYYSHGYSAVIERFSNDNPASLKSRYPVNLRILDDAQGVIVHSHYARDRAREWYGEEFVQNWHIVPLVRTKGAVLGREHSREILGLSSEDFIVCSFGFLDFTKASLRLLEAWLASSLPKNSRCKLFFVGENQGGDYGQQMLKTIADSGIAAQITITGWVDDKTYQAYLESADIAVQLRTQSRGETSAAVLDCLMYGLPTIINAHGSMDSLPSNALIKLPDNFTQLELVASLELLWQDKKRCAVLTVNAEQFIQGQHNAQHCVERYQEALHAIQNKLKTSAFSVLKSLHEAGVCPSPEEGLQLAQSLTQSFPGVRAKKQFLIDITATHQHDLRTGIERVTRALMQAFIANQPPGFRVEPIYLSREKGVLQYRYARKYVLRAFACPENALSDDIVEVAPGDILLGLDVSGQLLIDAEEDGLLQSYRNQGVHTYFVVHDLLPLLLPECFPPGATPAFKLWLEAVLKNNGVLCVSESVADDLKRWIKTQDTPSYSGHIGWFHHGADFENSFASKGISNQAELFLNSMNGKINFIMVGTIEPRKAHLQVINAFQQLWTRGYKANLLIVGNEGWKNLSKSSRRTIPQTLQAISKNSELNKQLFWLPNVNDAYLARLYQSSQCLIMASEGEGFGLPLLEAARYKIPILARDLPVFKEILGSSATYFSGKDPDDLALAITRWDHLYSRGEHARSDQVKHQTWHDSAQQIRKQLLPNTL